MLQCVFVDKLRFTDQKASYICIMYIDKWKETQPFHDNNSEKKER